LVIVRMDFGKGQKTVAIAAIVADRQALIAQEEHDHRAADGEVESAGPNHRESPRSAAQRQDTDVVQSEPLAAEEFSADTAEAQPPEFEPSPEHDSEHAAQREESAPP